MPRQDIELPPPAGFVRQEDYTALQARLAEVEAERGQWAMHPTSQAAVAAYDAATARAEAAEARVKVLVEALDNLLEAITASDQIGDRSLTITGPTANLRRLLDACVDARAALAAMETQPRKEVMPDDERDTHDARPATSPGVTAGAAQRVQHIRRGTTYRVLGRGQLQTDTDLRDYDEVVAYQCEGDGRVWVRAAAEFDDPTRFRILAALDVQPAPEVAALDDGRPCATDVFLAAAMEQLDDKSDFFEAVRDWCEGDWKGALTGIELPALAAMEGRG
jgi:hypothetical protein